MQLPVHVEQVNGHFEAVLLGRPSIRVEAPSRTEALARLRMEISRRLVAGDLVMLDIPVAPLPDIVGILKHDPTLPELVEEIYRQRDAEPYPGEE